MAIQFTTAQQNAIDAKGNAILVSAAAGSGKTFTLTQRIIKSIREGNGDLSRMLIVTFTRAAAADMKAKISKALTEAIAEDPSNPKLQQQMLKLGGAHISTIDSFFSDPVRQNFEKLNLPASMRLCDEAELMPIKESIMSSVLELFYEKYGNSNSGGIVYGEPLLNGFTYLTNILTNTRDSSNLIPTLIKLYEKLITAPLGISRLEKHAERARNSKNLDFFETDEGKIVLKEIKAIVTHSLKLLDYSIQELSEDFAFGLKYLPFFLDDRAQCIYLLDSLDNGYQNAQYAFLGFEPKRIVPLKLDQKSEKSERFRLMRNENINGPITSIANDIFNFSQEEISRGFEITSEITSVVCEILYEYEKLLSNEKLRRGICEFSDMPKFMLKLLEDKNGNPTEYANSLYARYDEVYIDEYQDVNEIQDRIFSIIGRDHRFMVGDIKQSIYGFRDAEPSLFANYRSTFSQYNENGADKNSNGIKIFMSENFRCDKNVIDFSNLVCSKIFSAFSKSIEYTSEDDLKFAKKIENEHYNSPKVVLNIIEKINEENKDDKPVIENSEDSVTSDENFDDENIATADGNFDDEAIVTANEIARLIREEKRADGKKLRGGDITILLRDTKKSSTNHLIHALQYLNIKYSFPQKSSFNEDRNLKILIDLLSVIDNPTIDIPLCSVLCEKADSYTPKFTLEELLKIRKQTSNAKSLYDALVAYEGKDENAAIEAKCKDFIDLLSRLRNMSMRLTVDKLLRAISLCKEFSALCENDGYVYMYDCACKYEKNAASSLYGFLSYFKKLLEAQSSPEDKEDNSDTVRIMTIHHSKGLEFNTCFLYGFGKKFNLSDSNSGIIYTKDFGLSSKFPTLYSDMFLGTSHSENPLLIAAKIRTNQNLIEEAARVFYVALTRAKERLYISASLNKDFPTYSYELLNSPDVSYDIVHSQSYIKWVILSLSSGSNECFNFNFYKKGTCSFVGKDTSLPDIMKLPFEYTAEEKDLAKLLANAPKENPEEKILSTVPSKIAASMATETMLEDSVFIAYPLNQLFAEKAETNDESDTLRLENAENIKNRIKLMRSGARDFDSILEINKKPTASEIGTATHQFLQFCDYKMVEETCVDAEISRLLEKKFISQRTASIIDKQKLADFFKSDIYTEIKRAKNIRRELRFGLFRPASDFTKNQAISSLVADKKIFVQGSIDLIIETFDGKILLCDYKTDRISNKERQDPNVLLENMKKKHFHQLAQYKYAVNKIFGREPDEVYIYLLSAGKSIKF